MKARQSKKATPKKATNKAAQPAKEAAAAKRISRKELSQLEALALEYYCRGDSQKDIAVKTGISEKTISKWANDPAKDWENARKSMLTSKTEILKNLYNVLLRLNEKLNEDNNIGDTKLADAFVKYTASIKNLETETNIGQMVETAMQFVKDVQTYDNELAKTITTAFNAFIQKQLKRFK